MREQLANMKDINQVTCYGKADNKIPILWWFFLLLVGHMVEPLTICLMKKLFPLGSIKMIKKFKTKCSLVFENW